MLAELIWLIAVAHWPVTIALMRLLPGAMMMLALRAALIGAGWRWIALSLALAFPAHLADLASGTPRRR